MGNKKIPKLGQGDRDAGTQWWEDKIQPGKNAATYLACSGEIAKRERGKAKQAEGKKRLFDVLSEKPRIWSSGEKS